MLAISSTHIFPRSHPGSKIGGDDRG